MNTASDSNNCGGCGIPCNGGQTCQNSQCACPSRPARLQRLLRGVRRDPLRELHERLRTANEVCSGSTCSSSCAGGQTLCGTACCGIDPAAARTTPASTPTGTARHERQRRHQRERGHERDAAGTRRHAGAAAPRARAATAGTGGGRGGHDRAPRGTGRHGRHGAGRAEADHLRAERVLEHQRRRSRR